MFDGQMAYDHSGAQPVYAPNSEGRGWADGEATPEESWAVDGEMVRSAYELHADDDDFSQPGALVRDVMDDGQRERLVAQVSGRSEEHTSELQSLMRISNAVFCLKKKKNMQYTTLATNAHV